MDIDATLRQINGKLKALFFARYPNGHLSEEIDVPDYDATVERLKKVKGRLAAHYRLTKQRNTVSAMLARIDDEMDQAEAAIASGKILMAFDTERTFAGLTKEVGVSLYQSGTVTSFNYRIEGITHNVGFSFGETIVVSNEGLVDILTQHVKSATFLLGHSLVSDFKHLRSTGVVLPHRPFFDTYWWAERFRDRLPEIGNRSLSALCGEFGVMASRPHSGGNDARYTLELILAMLKARGI